MTIQAILFDKRSWTEQLANSWLWTSGYRPISMRNTKGYYRFRLIEPDKTKYIYRTQLFGDGIKVILQYSKP